MWQSRQKRRELQFDALKQFYGAYGAFVTTWKLWNNAVHKNLRGEMQDFHKRQLDLLEKAAAAEAQTEGILLKIATETMISIDTACMLGCFRQAFKQLRKCIRRGVELPYGSSEVDGYVAFKVLSSRTATILSRPWSWRTPSATRACERFSQITSNDREREWIEVGLRLRTIKEVKRRNSGG